MSEDLTDSTDFNNWNHNEMINKPGLDPYNCLDPKRHRKRENVQLSCVLSARSATGQDTRSGQGALARRHTDGQLRAALLKTTVMFEACRRRTMLLRILFLTAATIRRS